MKAYPRYLKEQAVVAVIVNLLLNGALTWLIYRGLTEVPLEGPTSIVGGTLVTSFLLSLIVMPAVRKDVKAGRVNCAVERRVGLLSNAFFWDWFWGSPQRSS